MEMLTSLRRLYLCNVWSLRTLVMMVVVVAGARVLVLLFRL